LDLSGAEEFVRRARGKSNDAIARIVGIGRMQVGPWPERYAKGGGLAAIAQRPPQGGRPSSADAAETMRLTTQATSEGAACWSTRGAREEGGGERHDRASAMAASRFEAVHRADLICTGALDEEISFSYSLSSRCRLG